MADFNLIRGVVNAGGPSVSHQPIITAEDRVTSSNSAESQMYGRVDDEKNIVKMLLDNVKSKDQISVCPIIGVGGLGKTTLTQYVFHNKDVEDHFQERIWICVSDNFDVYKLLKEIVECVTERRLDLDNLDMVWKGVVLQLTGKRFLLVLDDLWSEDQDKWNLLKNCLNCGASGSSIIVTTRLERVASLTKTMLEPYRLSCLSEENCWSLFKSRAFGVGKELVHPNLERIGKEIVRKCGGLPLAAKVLGSMLWGKVEERHWMKVRDSEIWNLEKEENNKGSKILPALLLSYFNLTPRERQCFAYCSFFPKGYEMSKEELLHLWMANGLLEIENEEPGDVGEDVFIELKLHSFFQDIKENGQEHTITLKIHDLLHDLASSVMEREYRRDEVEVGKVQNVIRFHHMSINLLPSSQSPLGVDSGNHPFNSSMSFPLRTLFLFSNNNQRLRLSSHDVSVISGLKYLRALRIERWSCILKELPPSFGNKLKHLRMLSLSGCHLLSLQAKSFCGMKNLQFLDLSRNSEMKSLPDSIGDLEKLRHLDLSYNSSLETLPESLGNLTKLETLKLNGCRELRLLPQNTSMLCSLKHLENEHCGSLRGMQHLTHLEKLSRWVGESENIAELRALNLLSGSLGIDIMTSESKGVEARHIHWEEEEEVLTNKTNLSRLQIFFCSGRDEGVHRMDEQVLRVLKPPPNIEDLPIWGYKGRMFPDWMQMRDPHSSFPRLQRIVLEGMPQVKEWRLNWREKECLPALQHLQISWCVNLKALPEELGNLTSLKSLNITDCNALVSVPTALRELTSLESLKIRNCRKLMSLPLELQLMTSLKRLEIRGCPRLKFVFHGLPHLTSLQTLQIQKCPEVVIPKEELETLVALRGSNRFQNIVDEERILDLHDPSTSKIRIGSDYDDDDGHNDISY